VGEGKEKFQFPSQNALGKEMVEEIYEFGMPGGAAKTLPAGTRLHPKFTYSRFPASR